MNNLYFLLKIKKLHLDPAKLQFFFLKNKYYFYLNLMAPTYIIALNSSIFGTFKEFSCVINSKVLHLSILLEI
ncbi:hypothetical protein AsAng_0051960 [Aureispira anguillae]|uniref:Uncharacterized protein n=1 Tax=Aureispira anguillae TaxID=2864201 RepID=A0A915YK57_9BACT|nr:hypothetical protein AsAng_0051960 [Aureispira anguillae]